MVNVALQTIDGRNVRGPVENPDSDDDHYGEEEPPDMDGGYTWPDRATMDVENMARDAFGRVDELHNENISEDGEAPFDGMDVEENEQLDEEALQRLFQESTEKIFEGSQVNRL